MNQRDHTICEVCDHNKATHVRITRTSHNRLAIVGDCLCGPCAANPSPDHFVRPMTRTELAVLADPRPVTRAINFISPVQGAR